MVDNSTNNKRIAKNTMFMYFRMSLMIGVGLYTSRVILNALGIDDYGLYNVIGGIIGMFGFINGAMSNATSRYITFNLGRGDKNKVNQIFNLTLLLHIVIALFIVLIGETFGLWYLHNQLVIPEGRFFAAQFLYQLTICTAVINIISIPYNASIIAHEKMSAFAYISILDAIMKLIIAFAIMYASFDRLILYGILLFFVHLADRFIYALYCKRNFDDSFFKFYWDKAEFKEILGYAGWNMFGSSSFVFYNQGINLLLNFYFGPAVNAARGICHQIENLVKQFANSVQTAINPQIIKSYAQSDLERMHLLIYSSSRYCFYLLFLISLPILIDADFILSLWLGIVPQHTVSLMRITLWAVMMDCFINPLWTANNAYGKVKKMQLAVSLNSYFYIPIIFIGINYVLVPEIVFVIYLISRISSVFVRIIILKKSINLSIMGYIKNVLIPIGKVIIPSVFICCFIIKIDVANFIDFVISVISVVATVAIIIYSIGMNNQERNFINNKTKLILNKIKR